LDFRCLSFCAATNEKLESAAFRLDIAENEIEKALSGKAPALGFSWRWQDDRSVWHDAPDSKKRWPAVFFGHISYRPGNKYGDARVVWEPSRLQHLVALALIARGASNRHAAAAVACLERQFLSWLDANPPLTGIHYVSAMECALRIIAVCHALDLVRHRLARTSEVWMKLPAMVFVHASLIERRLSTHSSLGNHTIAECAGLIYAGCLFPELPRAERWRLLGTELLAEEAARQVLADGGGIEQAFWYHAFVVDLCGLSAALLERCDHRVPEPLSDAVKRGRGFLESFSPSASLLPDIGDRDGGWAVSPYLAISWPNTRRCSGAKAFPVSGYTRVDLDRESNSFVVLDHGPLGMKPGYGHGHADALSLTLYMRGQAVLIDSGTYGYGLDDAFAATSAGQARTTR
jgi:hypothetical protein